MIFKKIDSENKSLVTPAVICNGIKFMQGDKVIHFKYETLTDEEKNQNKYVYMILGFGTHTETKEVCVIYQSLDTNKIWIRPASMFASEVDHEKYPNIKQKYRFMKILE